MTGDRRRDPSPGKRAAKKTVKQNASRAWESLFSQEPSSLAGRSRDHHPRARGITMMLDRCQGLAATRDLVELAGSYLDQIKLSFGSSLLLDEQLLVEKTSLVRERGIDIYPGGTLFELASTHGILPDYVDWVVAMGFTAIEISDGVVDMPRQRRDEGITRGLEAGLVVLTEVGKKDSAQPFPVPLLCEQAEADLASGARWVIIEARESGRGIGIFDQSCQVRDEVVDEILRRLDPHRDRILWEAPRQSQQTALIRKCGQDVNLGNVKPRDVLGLEALRCGLRFETFDRAGDRSPRAPERPPDDPPKKAQALAHEKAEQ